MREDAVRKFLESRKAIQIKRPVDRLYERWRSTSTGDTDEEPTKKKFDTPDVIPPKPDGDKPTIRRPKPRVPGMSM